jgi:glycosyltransferase involved in cell wall biosynthesis
MRIGVDATCWQNMRGYGRHARSLLTALVQQDKHNQYTFFIDSDQNIDTFPRAAKAHLVRASAPTTLAASSDGHRSAGDMWRMSREMSRARLDLLLFPTIYSYVPVFSRAKKIVMIHDIIAETYPRLTLPGRTARLFWKAKVALGRWQADAVATVSEYSRQGIMRRFNLSADRVSVVGEASDPVFHVIEDAKLPTALHALGLRSDQRFIVYVGGFNPHKNLEALVGAFARLASQERFSDLRLVMVGENKNEVFHSYFETIKSDVERLGIADRAHFTGYLPDEELAALLNVSTVLVLPSLIEGFGLPAVEAAACGCPVIATSASPLPGLLGEAGIYFDPHQPDELTKALERVLSSEELRRRMRDQGIAAAKRLTWEAASRQLANLMERVMAEGSRNGSRE